jgi:hypothetical protein
MANLRGGWNGLLSCMLLNVVTGILLLIVGKQALVASEIKAIYTQDKRLRSNGISLTTFAN